MAKQIRPKRPYTTDYGTTKGHCSTPNGAKKAAICYLIDNDQRHCTIEGPDGAIARVKYNGFWGLFIEAQKGQSRYVGGGPRHLTLVRRRA